MKISGENQVEEKYTGRHTKDYTGNYRCDGYTCNCSWFRTKYMCRHIVYLRKSQTLPLYEKKMFHKSFHSSQFSTTPDGEDFPEENGNEGLHETSDIDDNVDAPGSPGMEYLLHELNAENKKLPKNVKFNKSFDVAKLCADYLKNAPSQTFEKKS